MQESRETLHDQEDGDGQHGEGGENHKKQSRSDVALPRQRQMQDHVPQHLWQLCGDNTSDSQSQSHDWLEKQMNTRLGRFDSKEEVMCVLVLTCMSQAKGPEP